MRARAAGGAAARAGLQGAGREPVRCPLRSGQGFLYTQRTADKVTVAKVPVMRLRL